MLCTAFPAALVRVTQSLTARLRFAESLKAYEKAVELQRRKVRQAAARGGVSVAGVAEVIQTRVPAKLLNNAAVLYMRVGRPHKALELLEEALEVRADNGMLTIRMLPCPALRDACLSLRVEFLNRLSGWLGARRTQGLDQGNCHFQWMHRYHETNAAAACCAGQGRARGSAAGDARLQPCARARGRRATDCGGSRVQGNTKVISSVQLQSSRRRPWTSGLSVDSALGTLLPPVAQQAATHNV